ncbi:terminase small subunit [Peribacillus deserti]|uniref:terminase small subunit n=1 Tax=Peribacillus deserti TaxID=673318 RepID=UPI0015E07D6B|nr:terminase small subunit [Peribacillus deserti]
MASIQLDEVFDYTEKEIAFCNSYVKTNNGTLSAVKAGYSEKNATVIASAMLKKEKITQLDT